MKRVFAITIMAFLAIGSVHAGTHKTIYMHGLKPFKNLTTACQGKSTCHDGWNAQLYKNSSTVHVGYWTLVNPTYSYNTSSRKSGSVQLLSMLNAHCRRDQGKSCEIICGSLGCYTTSYTLATYNGSRRYNVIAVSPLASAEGGSEVANLGTGIVSGLASALTGIFGGALTSAILGSSSFGALRTSYARSRWDHNRNNGTIFYHKAGDKGLWPLNWIWKGDHDRMVAFHSACGYRDMRAFSRCGGQSESKRKLKWVKVSGKRFKRLRWVTETTHYYPYTGHRASSRISSSGIQGAQHGYMSKTASAQYKR